MSLITGTSVPDVALHPVGPLPPATYWWRRAVVVGIPLAVVLLLLRGCASSSPPLRSAVNGVPSPVPSAADPVLPTPDTTPATTPASTPGTTPTGSTATPGPSATPSATTIGTCANDSLALSTTPSSPSVPAGAAVVLRLVVSNASLTPCTRDLGGGPVEVLVTHGRSRVWSSDDCGSTTGSSLVLLTPGSSRTIEVRWAGNGSRPGCRGTGGTVPPGRYALIGRVGTLRVAGGSVTLT